MRILCCVFRGYLELLKRTVRLEVRGGEKFDGTGVIGFWHEDSFAMNLILNRITKLRKEQVFVLVTGDPRGDCIQYLVEKNGGRALRIDYQAGQMAQLRGMLRLLKGDGACMAVAMDGPLGPRYQPKKLVYVLSEQSRTPLTGVTLSYSGRIALTRRWDHYRIPLPFSRVVAELHNYGIADSRHPFVMNTRKNCPDVVQ